MFIFPVSDCLTVLWATLSWWPAPAEDSVSKVESVLVRFRLEMCSETSPCCEFQALSVVICWSLPVFLYIMWLRGLLYMTSAKISEFFTLSPLDMYRNQLILFHLSAFWISPPPSSEDADVIYGSPLTLFIAIRHRVYTHLFNHTCINLLHNVIGWLEHILF